MRCSRRDTDDSPYDTDQRCSMWAAMSISRWLLMPSTSGSGPASTHARSSSCRAGLSFSGRPGRGRLRSPARPSALKRTTASRSDWRSRPTRRAASARLAPSNACAIASARNAAQRSASPCANRRKSAAPTSFRITKPRAPIRLPPFEHAGRESHFSHATDHIRVSDCGNWYYTESGQSRANQGIPRFACNPDLNHACAPISRTTRVR